jgi:thiamine biosynthesis lipoprotein
MMEYRQFRAMNSDIVLAAEGEKSKLRAGFLETHDFIDHAEKLFTRFSDESELSQLNRNAGHWFSASDDLFEVVRLAANLHEQTHGLFDPGILDALRLAGYNRSMDELRTAGPQPEIPSRQPAKPDFKAVKLDSSGKRIWLPKGTHIDLGGIAKGWIAEQAARLLSRYSTACAVSAGGDMVLIGIPEGNTTWPVGLEDPLDPSRDLAVLKIGPGAIATSSTSKRRWIQGNQVQHHLIDPRTGKPAITDWLSVTVICPQAAIAEVYAKALLIAGPLGAASLDIAAHNIVFITVDKFGKLWGSEHSDAVLSGKFEHA